MASTNLKTPAARRAIATALLVNHPNVEQVGRAISAIRGADAEEFQAVIDKLRAENRALRTALHTVIRELTPKQSAIILTELGYLATPTEDEA